MTDATGKLGHLDTSRREAAMGKEALQALTKLRVLVIGCRGAGIEAAKNVVLLGPKSICVWDPHPAKIEDLGCNFYLNENDVKAKTPRATACEPELVDLNPFSKVTTRADSFADVFKDVRGKQYTIVIVTDLLCLTKKELFDLSEVCHALGVVFLMALASGVTAALFSDFGPNHVITDIDGVPTNVCAVASLERITLTKNDEKGWLKPDTSHKEGRKAVIITVSCELKKELENGTSVSAHDWDTGTPLKLSDFKGGLAPLNDAKGFTVTRVFRRVKVARTNKDGSFQRDADNNIKYSTREYNQFHQFELNMEEATGKDGKPLVIEESAWGAYESGGILTQLKKPQTVKFKSFVQSLQDPSHEMNIRKRFDMTLMDTVPAGPQYCYGDGWEQGVGRQLHLEWCAVLDFQEQEGRYPRVHDANDARLMVKLAKAIAEKVEFEGKKPFLDNGELDENRIINFSKLFQTELCGFTAFVGGVVAQEIVKKSGKYQPLTQWLHWDDLALVPKSMTDNRPTIPSRYAHQISIFGQAWQNKVMSQKVFLVGAGALGCEYMKELALMGVGCRGGHVTVTDMDSIEASNLTRQFLFRAKHIDAQKSAVAAEVVTVMNPEFNVTALTGENNDAKGMVAPSTEHVFTDAFWEDKDLIWNALDNVAARQYVDKKCLWHGKPLLESGTLSTQCNSEVFLPFKTMSYSDGVDEEPDAIAMCTVRNFPHLPLHCIEWAKVDFENTFVKSMQMYNQFVKDKAEFFKMVDQLEDPGDILQPVRSLVELQLKFAGKTIAFEQCVDIAFRTFCAQFRHRILDLVHTFPEDHVSKSGKKFWSGHKRFPQVAEWSLKNEMAIMYLFASANLYAFALKIKGIERENIAKFKGMLEKYNLKAPDYKPNKVAVEEDEGEGKKDKDKDAGGAAALTRTFLSDAPTEKLQEVQVTKFEKDDDKNFHIDYMTHAANLRAWNYNIAASTRQTVRVTAGKILPALVTTTAMITGLQCLEFCKYMMGLQYLDQSAFRNWNINLGTSTFNSFDSSDPPAIRHGLPPYGNQRESDLVHYEKKVVNNIEERILVKHKAYPPGWTNWDHLVCDAGNLTGPQFAEWMEKFLGYGLKTEMVYSAGFSLWDATEAKDSLASRVPLANLYAHMISSGAKKQGRAINRVKKIVQRLNDDPKSGVRLEAIGGNAYNLVATLSGPANTPYTGGEFHISVKLPFEYPNKAPTVRFLTKIYHVNIDENGVPCPGQFALDVWTPSTTLEVLFNNIRGKLADPDDESPLYTPIGGAKHDTDEAAYDAAAAKWTQLYAAPGIAAPADDSAAEEVTEESLLAVDLKVIGRDYLVLESVQLDEKTGKPCGGYFSDPEGNVADLPRIKFVFTGAAAKADTDTAVEETLESVEIEAGAYRDSLIAFAAEADSENPIQDVTNVYKLEPQRAARYSKIADMGALKADGSNAVCLVGKDEYDETAEMILRLDDDGKPVEVCQAEDSIMMECTNLHGFPEYRFPGTEWRVSTAGKDALVQWRNVKFKDYETNIKKCPPNCLAGLGKMLHLGPVTNLYGLANDPMFPMTEEEKVKWTVVPKDNPKNKTFLPLQLNGLRCFNPVSRSYEALDMRLGGAPPADKEEEWFAGVVRHLKTNFQGGPAADQFFLDINENDLLCPRFMKSIEESGTNKWTDLVFKTKGVLKK